jgi:hypothetical protein
MENAQHHRMGGTRSSEGVEHEVLLQGEHDGHVTFSANQILFYLWFIIWGIIICLFVCIPTMLHSVKFFLIYFIIYFKFYISV